MANSEHISDSELEEYYLGMLPEFDLAKVEEHLLWCSDCLSQMAATERYVDAIRGAAIAAAFDREIAGRRGNRPLSKAVSTV